MEPLGAKLALALVLERVQPVRPQPPLPLNSPAPKRIIIISASRRNAVHELNAEVDSHRSGPGSALAPCLILQIGARTRTH